MAASVGQGVAAAQAQSVAQVLVHLRVRSQPGLFPAETGESEFPQTLLKTSSCKQQQHRVLLLLSTSQANLHLTVNFVQIILTTCNIYFLKSSY